MDRRDLLGQVLPFNVVKDLWPKLVEQSMTLVPQGRWDDPNLQVLIDVVGSGAGGGAAGGGSYTWIEYVELNDADTEYLYVIPKGVTSVEFTLRRAAKTPGAASDSVRISYETGVVASGVGACKTFTGDKEYVETTRFLADTTVYFASSVAGAVMEIKVNSSVARIIPPVEYKINEYIIGASATSEVPPNFSFMTYDDNTDDFWLSGEGDSNPAITYFFPWTQQLYSLNLLFDASNAGSTINVETSTDFVNWSLVNTFTVPVNGIVKAICGNQDFTSVRLTYATLVGDAAKLYQTNINSITPVYSSDITSELIGAAATDEDGANFAFNVYDGNTETYWKSLAFADETDTKELTLYFGEVKNLCGFTLNASALTDGFEYDVLYSADNVNFETVFTGVFYFGVASLNFAVKVGSALRFVFKDNADGFAAANEITIKALV